MKRDNESILVLVDLVGFRGISTALAQRCEHLGFNVENAHVALRAQLEHVINLAKATATFESSSWGTDGFILRFLNQDEALATIRIVFERCFLNLTNGVSLLKPVIAITVGELSFTNQQPTGNAAMSLHEACGKNPVPFSLLVSENITPGKAIESNFALSSESPEFTTESGVKYKRFLLATSGLTHPIPYLHLHSLTNNLVLFDTLLAEGESKAVALFENLQSEANETIRTIGGGPLIGNQMFVSYTKAQIAILKEKSKIAHFQFQRIALCYEEEPLRSYCWLQVNSRLLKMFSRLYQFRVLFLSSRLPKPLAFYIIDQRYITLGLRSYNSKHSTQTMARSMCWESPVIASAFADMFNEYWRSSATQLFSADQLEQRARRIKGLTKEQKQEALSDIETIFREAV
jgi:hypothetical protein